MGSWRNHDGLTVLYGNSRSASQHAGGTKSSGVSDTITMDFDWRGVVPTLPATTSMAERYKFGMMDVDTDGDGIPDAYSQMNTAIPPNSFISRATLFIFNAWETVIAPTLRIGTYLEDGSAFFSNGIEDGVGKAALSANAVIECDGVQIGSSSPGDIATVPTYIRAFRDGFGAFTAGSARLVVEYISPRE